MSGAALFPQVDKIFPVGTLHPRWMVPIPVHLWYVQDCGNVNPPAPYIPRGPLEATLELSNTFQTVTTTLHSTFLIGRRQKDKKGPHVVPLTTTKYVP